MKTLQHSSNYVAMKYISKLLDFLALLSTSKKKREKIKIWSFLKYPLTYKLFEEIEV